MLTGYKIAALLLVLLLGVVFVASYLGWGVASDASVRAKSVRQGSLHGRRVFGGGPGYGK
jgi:hypothetical protein